MLRSEQLVDAALPEASETRSAIIYANAAPAATVRRFLVFAAIAFWLGGFTFYASVAIPMGVEVLGSHRIVGFITQRVTNWLNVSGSGALAILLWNTAAAPKNRRTWVRSMLILTWLLMAGIQIQLIYMHPILDRLLTSAPRRAILDEPAFDHLHRIYLVSTTLQWGLGLLHVWCICVAWGREYQ